MSLFSRSVSAHILGSVHVTASELKDQGSGTGDGEGMKDAITLPTTSWLMKKLSCDFGPCWTLSEV